MAQTPNTVKEVEEKVANTARSPRATGRPKRKARASVVDPTNIFYIPEKVLEWATENNYVLGWLRWGFGDGTEDAVHQQKKVLQGWSALRTQELPGSFFDDVNLTLTGSLPKDGFIRKGLNVLAKIDRDVYNEHKKAIARQALKSNYEHIKKQPRGTKETGLERMSEIADDFED